MLQTLLKGQNEGGREAVRAVSQRKGLLGFSCTPFKDRGVWFSWIQIDHLREVDWE